MRIIKKDFEAWLRKNYHVFVGYQRRSSCCPLAIYINDNVQGADFVTVSGVIEYVSAKNDRRYYRRLPPWARRFIHNLDNVTIRDNTLTITESVTGEDALEVLAIREEVS